jgi:hypothetical protein
MGRAGAKAQRRRACDGGFPGACSIMRFHTYSKFSPEMADQVDLQSLLDKLADFLLQSGFAGPKYEHP